MPSTKKPAAKKRAAPKKPSAGARILAAIKDLSTPAAITAAITGTAPPGAPFTVTRVKLPAGAFAAPALTGADVAALRAELGLTQATFAAFIGVTIQTVQAWEQGRNPVPGMALRFLAEVRADVGYWNRRIAAAAG